MTFVEVVNRENLVDVGDPGDSPGDYFLFEATLKNRAGTKTLGRDSGQCTLGARTFICEATAQIFGKGKITVYGAFFGEFDPRIAITGGTGDFRDAGGTLAVTDAAHGNSLLVFQVTD